MIPPSLKNIKIHFQITNIQLLKTTLNFHPEILKESLDIDVKRYNNFCVLRKKYVYIIFADSGYVNVTKIPNYESIEKCIKEFCEIFSFFPSEISKHVIDNSTYSGNLNKTINILSVHRRGLQQLRKSTYNLDFFPAVFLRFSGGTINLFKSGKFMLVGVKKKEDISRIMYDFKKLL